VLLRATDTPQALMMRPSLTGLTPLHAAMVAQISIDDITSTCVMDYPYPTFESVAQVMEAMLDKAHDKSALFSARASNGRTVLNLITHLGYFELLSHFTDPENRMVLLRTADNEGNTALHHAVARASDRSCNVGLLHPLESILEELKTLSKEDLQAFLLARGKDGKTALHLAFEGSDADAAAAAQMFLAHAPNPSAIRSARDIYGQTALHLACGRGFFLSTSVLVEKWNEDQISWSDLSMQELEGLLFAQDNDGNTPTHCLVMDERDMGLQREMIACKLLRLLGHATRSNKDAFPQRIMKLLAMENLVSLTILDFGPLQYNHKMGAEFLVSWKRAYREFGPSGKLESVCFCENPVYRPRDVCFQQIEPIKPKRQSSKGPRREMAI